MQQQPRPPSLPPEPEYGGVWRVLAAIALALAGLASAAYGAWAITARRAIFAALANGESVSPDTAVESDRLHEVLLWSAVGTLAAAAVFWLLAHLLRRKPLGIAGFTAIALFVIGLVTAVGGAYLTSLVGGDAAAAGTGAAGFLVMGIGFLLVACGAVAALVAVFVRPSHDDSPSVGFADWHGR